MVKFEFHYQKNNKVNFRGVSLALVVSESHSLQKANSSENICIVYGPQGSKGYDYVCRYNRPYIYLNWNHIGFIKMSLYQLYNIH